MKKHDGASVCAVYTRLGF